MYVYTSIVTPVPLLPNPLHRSKSFAPMPAASYFKCHANVSGSSQEGKDQRGSRFSSGTASFLPSLSPQNSSTYMLTLLTAPLLHAALAFPPPMLAPPFFEIFFPRGAENHLLNMKFAASIVPSDTDDVKYIDIGSSANLSSTQLADVTRTAVQNLGGFLVSRVGSTLRLIPSGSTAGSYIRADYAGQLSGSGNTSNTGGSFYSNISLNLSSSFNFGRNSFAAPEDSGDNFFVVFRRSRDNCYNC